MSELTEQKINDRVAELLYSLDEMDNELAAATLAVGLVSFLDSIHDAGISQHVISYLNTSLPPVVKKSLQ
jgi:hypothetical protein